VVVVDAALSIRRGMTAVVGPSGAGKSSLALALAGLVPSHGLRLGADPAEADAERLRAEVVYVPQRSTLFTGTVRENLLLGDPSADDAALIAALAAAGFSHGGGELPDGLDTRVGQGAEGVSGGQAQRISIARALLTGRDILVADEPTAHLDAEAAARVMGTLRSLAGRRAVVVITHRLAETEAADEVVVIENGRITASGPPETLRTEPGFYATARDVPAGDATTEEPG
jgi:ABC-type transport system involved in cytochrome bd biosynthesis fused ATPase/permease subunit